MFERFDDSARRTVVLAQEEARMLNHNYVGTEHLLLALTRDPGPAGQALTALSVTRGDARDHIIEIIGAGLTRTNGHIPFTPRVREVLENSVRFALQCADSNVRSGHLLQSLLVDDESVAALTIAQSGTTLEAIGDQLTDLMTAPEPSATEPEPRFVLSA
ncbi:Clp domain protein (plasmid) [Pseudarthrobacter chlorophenolicus A6]|uniref:Clp domain protein n=1 Tax=Pseudarthrobacter chlorophenolicus (strain ATCC 700700 / DSM 12829 / CIP 107037 / JCM 12360 / KCTC 9906 / NCIMB 13794 / A6) TaxID=452863 RepID=B8HIE9_PSECP|nr:Clp protease N-terminal domain-containing protein [Pseudarthrobacter chlorophenolicus]ACL42196.1 Clp domain protein [Pseudarthrobacter chlorophenolicus A6]SDQ14696.1 ATP-dependent Clp protease ATP-binding subunit ClpC [Pseudarthrobacter chlorophenolicus]